MKYQNTGINKVIRRYKNIRQPDSMFHVAKLKDSRIVPCEIVEEENTIVVTMPNLKDMGFYNLSELYEHHDPLMLINWSIELFDDLVREYIVPVDIHDSNIMSNGSSLVLVDYEQFWPWDRKREAYGRWRLNETIKVWAGK